jgi:hypothetical protein
MPEIKETLQFRGRHSSLSAHFFQEIAKLYSNFSLLRRVESPAIGGEVPRLRPSCLGSLSAGIKTFATGGCYVGSTRPFRLQPILCPPFMQFLGTFFCCSSGRIHRIRMSAGALAQSIHQLDFLSSSLYQNAVFQGQRPASG